MIFNTRLRRPKAVPVQISDGSQPKYEEVFEDGSRKLVVSGKENLHEYVQASKDSCLIENILSRYQRGDTSVLSARQGQYMDVVGMPTNLAEAHQIMISAERKFNQLDPELRRQFDNSVDVFIDKVAHADPESLRAIFGVPAPATPTAKEGDE